MYTEQIIIIKEVNTFSAFDFRKISCFEDMDSDASYVQFSVFLWDFLVFGVSREKGSYLTAIFLFLRNMMRLNDTAVAVRYINKLSRKTIL